MMRRKFFVDCHVFDGPFQGTTTYLKGLYNELIHDADKMFFLASNDTASLKTIFGEHENVTYLQYSSHNKFIRLLFDIPAMIKKNQIDYAHFQYIVPPFKFCKYIITVHDVLFLDFPEYFPFGYKLKNKLLFGKSTRYSDVVLTVSEYSKKQIQKHFGAHKITVTPNGVDAAYFESYDKNAVKSEVKKRYGFSDYWLFVSRWEPRKNHHTLLKAFVENRHYEKFHLVFVGGSAINNPAYNDYFDHLEPHVKSKIVKLDALKQKDLLLVLRGASLSVYPSIAEGFGIPPLESIAANVPTICSNETAMADFDFMQSHLFNPLNSKDISDTAVLALTDGETEAQRTAVMQKYNWAVAAAAFRKALQE